MSGATKDKFPHYWMCHKCALAMGGSWPAGHVATVVQKPCEYCGGKNHGVDEFIAPWVDYDWSEADLAVAARLMRD